MLIYFIFYFFSIKESSDLDQNEKVKISENLDEQKKLKLDDLSENTKVEVEKLKNKQATKDDLSKISIILGISLGSWERSASIEMNFS